MSSRISVFDKSGHKMVELDGNIKRTWVIGAYAEAEGTISLENEKAKREYLNFGNYLVVEHDKLPIWGGIIVPPRDWERNTVKFSAKSGEFLLTTRNGPTWQKWEGHGALILKQMVDYGNSHGSTLLKMGEYTPMQPWISRTQDWTKMYERLKELVDTTEQEWGVTPKFDVRGELYFEANWFPKMGMERLITLLEGSNLEAKGKVLTEQGTIVNELLGIGGGSTEEDKVFTTSRDADSIDDYGLFQSSEVFGDTTWTSFVSSVEASLAKTKQPRNTWDLTLLDVNDLFKSVRLGDTFPIKMLQAGWKSDGTLGFEGSVRVLGMTYDDISNKLDIVADEVIDGE
jgi:hypothetical protein